MALRKSDFGSIWACLLVCLLVLISKPQAQNQTLQVATTNGLTALEANLAGSGVKRVQFAPGGYSQPGQLSLTASSADSIIFERSAPDTSLVQISNRLLRFEGLTNTKVIIRGLAFRLDSPTAELLNGRASANQRLLIDSCILYADSVNSTVISWLGTKAEISRSMLVIRNIGTSPRIDLVADTITFSHNLFNFEGYVTGKTLGLINLTRNTVNKTQFNLTTDGSTQYRIEKNLFAYPPSQNRLPVGLANRFPVRILGDFVIAGSSAQSNWRDTSWTGFDLISGASLFTDASNSPVGGISGKSDTTLWDWRIPTDTAHGAWSGSSAQALPPHNIFPGQKSLIPENLPTDLRPTIHFDSASIPRYIPVTLTTSIAYPVHDSLRTYFIKDSAFVIGAPSSSTFFTFQSLVMPKPNTSGTPRLLGAPSGTTFVLGAAGVAGTNTFASPTPSARILIPAFGAQNTWKGNDRVVNLGNETSITFESVTRAGHTELTPARQVDTSILNSQGWKRYRSLLRNSNPLGSGFTSTAVLGLGSEMIFSLPRSGSTTPYNRDSIFAFDGNAFHKVIANDSHYSVTLSVSGQTQGMAFALFERLALGRGDDNLPLAQGHGIRSKSEAGYQFNLDSTKATDNVRMPHFDGQIRLFKPSWTGRGVRDSLFFDLKKKSERDSVYVFHSRPAEQTDSVVSVTPLKNDSASLTVVLNFGDNSNTYLLGRKYTIPATTPSSIYSKWSDGEHSMSHLFSPKPGEMRVDTALDPAAQIALSDSLGDSLQVMKQKRIIIENLDLSEYFEVTVKKNDSHPRDSVRAFVFRNDSWSRLPFDLKPEGWIFTLNQNDRQFALLRRLPKPVPVDTPTTDTNKNEPRLSKLTLFPRTHFLAEPNTEKTFTWTYTPDSVKADSKEGKVRFELCEWADTAVSSRPKAGTIWSDSLPGLAKVDPLGRVMRLKTADSAVSFLALRIYSEVRPDIADTAFVVLLSTASLDSITIKPEAPPEIKVVEGQPGNVSIVPRLNTADAKILSHVVVTQVSIDPTGKVHNKVDSLLVDTLSRSVILAISDAAITTFKVKYMSTSGVSTEDTTSYAAPLSSGFRMAVNALAPTLASDRRELIGSPFKVKLGELFPALNVAAKTPAPEIAAYEGEGWNRIDKHADNPNGPSIADVTLDSGKGYLVYLPQSSKPQLPDNVFSGRTAFSLLAPDTVQLVKGWQIITNPKPFAIADVDIELDSSEVSHFCQLKWSGSPLKEGWVTRVDTLVPFVGYAVYAKEATSIVFNPRKALAPQAKKATAKFVNLHLQTSWGESGTLTLTDAKTTRIFPKQGFASRLQTFWMRSQGLILTEAMQPGMNETFRVMGKSQGMMRLSLSASDLRDSGEQWYVWSPVMGELLSMSEKPEITMAPGWQEFQLLKLAPSSREGEERRLRSLYPTAFTYRIDFKRGRIAAAVPVGTGVSNSLSFMLFDLSGRIGHQSLHSNLQPGWHEWTLPLLQGGRTSGAAFLRLQWRDAQGHQSKLFPLGAQP